MPTITISTHNGPTFSVAHNIRDPNMVENENRKYQERHPGEYRIDPNGEYEVWVNQGLKEAYTELFDGALKEWNAKQVENGHPERQIKDYLSHLRAKEKSSKNAKKIAYEIIHSIGNKDNPVEPQIGKLILEEVVKTFQERNPNLHVFCQAFHNDENGVMHCHTTYIPVARNCSRGLSVQNSLSAALKQQGIEGTAFRDTPQMAFERRENEFLESVCNKHGYQVEHPMRGGLQEHFTVEEYRLKKELEETQKKLEEAKALPLGTTAIKNGRLQQLESIEKKYLADKPKIEQAKRDIIAAQGAMEAYTASYKQLEEDKRNFLQKVNEAANRKMKVAADKALAFIKATGLWSNFVSWVQQQNKREQQKQKQ